MKEIKSYNDIKATLQEHKKFILVLLIITFLAFSNVLRGEFVTADDVPGIVQNPSVQNFGQSLQSLNLVAIKNALIFQIAGLNPTIYHLVGILIHLINIVLVFIFVRTLFTNKNIAKIATILFALHPVTAESIMWISGNSYAMNATFSLLIFTAFVIFEKTENKKYFYTSVAIFFFMILHDRGAWPSVTPFILGIIDQFFFSTKIDIKRGLIIMLPFLVLVGVSSYIVINKNYSSRMDQLTKNFYFNPEEAPPLLNRAPFSIYMAARNLVFPYELNIYPGEKYLTPQDVLVINVVTLVLIGLTLYLLTKNRLYAGLILAIVASLGPTFSPVQVAWLMTERYLYLGSVFYAILISLLLLKLRGKHEQIFKISFGIIVLLFIIRLVLRSEDWRTNKNLWISTLWFSPDSYRVYNNLGDVYIKENNLDKAIESFSKSFEIFPGYADAMHNLGIVYMMKQDIVNAEKYMTMAIQVKPTLAPAWEKMGIIYYQRGDYQNARIYFNKALQLDPNSPIAPGALQEIGVRENSLIK